MTEYDSIEELKDLAVDELVLSQELLDYKDGYITLLTNIVDKKIDTTQVRRIAEGKVSYPGKSKDWRKGHEQAASEVLELAEGTSLSDE